METLMYAILVLSSLSLLQSSTAEQCPTSSSCTCSKDLTLVTCTNAQLTDTTFASLQSQLPLSTIVLNLSSNSLSSINSLVNLNNLQTLDVSWNKLQSLPSNLFFKYPQLSSVYAQENSLQTIPKSFNEISNINLDVSKNPLTCQCSSKWLIKWFETIHLVRPITCQKGGQLLESDFCPHRKDVLRLHPQQSQIVYENDSFTFNCSSANSDVFWTLNSQFYSSNSSVSLARVQMNHSGLWTCHSSHQNRSISLHVLQVRPQHFCQSIHMDTSKGHFFWPRTLTGQTIDVQCPFGSAAWLSKSNEQPRAFHTCSNNRQWTDLDVSQCAFRTNISREFDRLLGKNDTNLLSTLVTYISKVPREQFQFDDVLFLIDLIDEEQEKYRASPGNVDEISMLIYRLTDDILQINRHFFVLPQYQIALRRLRSIIERLLDVANRSWLYVGKQLTAMTLESPLPPTICFIPNRPLLTLICGIVNRGFKRHEARLATIQFELASNGSVNQSSVYRIIIYRQPKLFTSDSNSNQNPVIYLKPVSSNNASNVKVTFYGQANQASIVTWNSSDTVWQSTSSPCKLSQQNIDLISTDCLLTRNHSLSITYLNDFNEVHSLFLNKNYLELAVHVSSIIASVCLFISILFYIGCHKVYLMPRSFFHCLINYWLSLSILFPLFAFGIQLSDYFFFCQFIAVSLHYLCLTAIIWLTLFSYCIWQKLYMIWAGKGRSDDEEGDVGGKSSVTIVDYDDDGQPIMKLKQKPIIQFYFLAYGISFIICGINVAISREQYITNKICFLNNFESLLTIIIPMCVFVGLTLIFLLAARLNIKRLTKEAIRLRDVPDESEVEGELNTANEENGFSSKPNETLPIIVPSQYPNGEGILPPQDCRQSHLDSLCSSDMDHQHQPSNQLASILFQLLLLILLFLSSLSIYLHPLQSYRIRFEHSIYTHSYGFCVLLLAFYILSFYVLSRSDLTLHCKYSHCCSTRKKKRLLNQSFAEPPPPPQTPQQSPSLPIHSTFLPTQEIDAKIIFNQNLSADESFTEQIAAPSPPHSHYSSSIYNCQVPPTSEGTTLNNSQSYGSKYQATIASKYYARHRHMLKGNTSASETSLQQTDAFPLSTLKPIEQEATASNDEQEAEYDAVHDRSSKKLIQHSHETHSMSNGSARLPHTSIISPRTFIRPSTLPISPRPQASPSQAIIRPLPIIRLSSPSMNKSLPSPLSSSSSTIITNGHANAERDSTPGRTSYHVMPSPTTEQRHPTFVYLNKNSHLVQQENSPEEKPSVWKKPVNGHHPHVAYIDEDDEGSVSLKSSTCDSSTATSSNTASPIPIRKDRSQTLSSSSSSSSTFSAEIPPSVNETNHLILHESSV